MNEDGLWILDSEADGLLDEITKFHCLCFKKYGEDKWMMFLDEKHPEAKEAYNYCVNIREEKITVRRLSTFNEWVVSGDVKALACHFMFGFDLPAFNKILGTTFDFFPENINGQPIRLYDTLSISRNLNPDRPLPDGCPSKIRCPVSGKLKSVGAHGLQAWGYRINNMKPAIDDWRNQPLVTYINRVIEDVHINEGTWTLLKKEAQPNETARIDWNVPLWRGMASDYLMAEQERQGVVFDKEKAIILRDRIDVMMAEIEEDVEPQLPERLLPKSKQPVFPKEPFKQDGSISGTGINWLKRLGYEFDQDILDVTPPPKTAFKSDGSLSKAGENYCIKHGVEERDKMAMFIREQLAKSQQSIFKGGAQAEYCGKQDLRTKKMPKLTEPMRLSNQLDIKKYLVEVEGWKPTIMGTRIGFDVDDRKRKLPDDVLIPKIKKYIMDVYNSPFREFIYEELGYEFHKLKEDTLIDRLKKKARYLPSTPKFKDQRGELCPNLELLKGEMAKKIVKWLSLRNRRSVLESPDEGKDTGWLKNPRLEVDGKLGAGMSGLTNTTRYSHVTVVNVPKNDPDVLLGKEMRELFTVPDGYWQIGTDASNLEGFVAAWLAWDFDKGEYYRGLSGDPHTANSIAYTKAAGREVGRGEGKAITYGTLYGAQAAKISSMLGISKDKAQGVIDAYWDTNYGLKGAKEALEKYWEKTGKSYIRSIDGRKIYTRSKHSLLNARIQSTGAILMAVAGNIWHEKASKAGLLDKGVARVVFMHDEYQHQIPEDLIRWKKFDTKEEAENYSVDGFILSGNVKEIDGKWCRIWTKAGQLMVEAIEEAARELGCPFGITGEYLYGKRWSACH